MSGPILGMQNGWECMAKFWGKEGRKEPLQTPRVQSTVTKILRQQRTREAGGRRDGSTRKMESRQASMPSLPPILFASRPSFHSLSLFPSRYIAEFVPDCWTRGTRIAPLLRSSASRYYGDCFDLSVFPLREILKRHLRTKTSAFGNDSTSSKDELRHATYFSYDFEHGCS